uniref:Uncharacterized protein n=1 Tax=Gloeochaete wittrockiana TaxID=38269 RepID=A0A3G1IW09_9EUKA|nr:hypothetical protein [Gloeochaete wittrockiana]ASQ40246.1 hypothetical protein [Gloeochaete wittrockiana]
MFINNEHLFKININCLLMVLTFYLKAIIYTNIHISVNKQFFVMAVVY